MGESCRDLIQVFLAYYIKIIGKVCDREGGGPHMSPVFIYSMRIDLQLCGFANLLRRRFAGWPATHRRQAAVLGDMSRRCPEPGRTEYGWLPIIM
ncbi:hypothetical protein OPV22_024078 [Ensete ventricosum]|uniref:Uncharacterized protein n=1 Tax=Ensete ventricosum TaxID=4639 RepID=A0AAV8PDE1_ENSVE|nr:hypothetical protein OPV22_024078 [Ensete ventricosum]